MSQSIVNSSIQPLLAGRAFLGIWEDILEYATIQIQFKASTSCEIKLHQSSDKTAVAVETIDYFAGSGVLDLTRQVTGSFFYITVRNLGVDQTQLSLQTIYKVQSAINPPYVADVSLWNASILANGVTNYYYNTSGYKYVTLYGDASDVTDLALEVSADGASWYTTQYVYSLTTAGNFGYSLTIPFKFLRIKASDAQTKLVVFLSLA